MLPASAPALIDAMGAEPGTFSSDEKRARHRFRVSSRDLDRCLSTTLFAAVSARWPLQEDAIEP